MLAIQNTDNTDKTYIKDFITQNLDFYILNFHHEMYQLKITSLFNIFSHPHRNLRYQDIAYKFIKDKLNPTDIYVLIPTLDNLSDTCLIDSFKHKGY